MILRCSTLLRGRPDIATTSYVVVPLRRSADGDLMPLEPPNGESARRRAPVAVAERAGAIAFTRTDDPKTGNFGDTVILSTYGEVDHGMLGE